MRQVTERLDQAKKDKLFRKLKYIETSQSPKVRIAGKDVILFGSNNYLGLCNDPRLKQAAISAINKYGVGSGGSRLTTGSSDLHKRLEKTLASFKGTEASLVFNTGYMANIGIITALCNKSWVIFSDRLNHASIIDGCVLSGAKLIRYKHCDIDDLTQKINKYKEVNSIIITDGIFSMTGDVAPLHDIVKLAKQNDILTMIDDAHGTGVLGENGSGTASHFGVSNQIDILMGTLSKAVASEGGYVAGKDELIEYFKNFSRSFIYSTALSPAVIATSIKSLEIIENDIELRMNLLSMSNWFQKQLRDMGFNVPETITPIITILVKDPERAIQFSESLLEEGIYIPAIRPPTVPKDKSLLRISLMATHSQQNLDEALKKIKSIGQELQLIGG